MGSSHTVIYPDSSSCNWTSIQTFHIWYVTVLTRTGKIPIYGVGHLWPWKVTTESQNHRNRRKHDGTPTVDTGNPCLLYILVTWHYGRGDYTRIRRRGSTCRRQCQRWGITCPLNPASHKLSVAIRRHAIWPHQRLISRPICQTVNDTLNWGRKPASHPELTHRSHTSLGIARLCGICTVGNRRRRKTTS